MTNTFILLALFTVGSAVDVTVCDGNNNDVACVKDNEVGKCPSTAGACVVTGMCVSPKNAYDTCGAGSIAGMCKATGGKCIYTPTCTNLGSYCSNERLIGVCSNTGKCNTARPCSNKVNDAACGAGPDPFKGTCLNGECLVLEKSVKVAYTVDVPKAERTKYVAKLRDSNFHENFATSAVGCHPVENLTFTNGILTCSVQSHFPGAAKCTLACDSNFTKNVEHTQTCNATGVWTGQRGVCSKQCPLNGAESTSSNSDKTLTFSTASSLTPANGKIVCNDTYSSPGALCVLECDSGYHVKTSTGLKCTASQTWAGVKGECEEGAEIPAKAGLALAAGEKLTDVIQKNDKAFNKRFIDSVSSLLGVLPENVSIVTIADASNRRLQVDYTVRVPKGDTEGTIGLDKVDGSGSPEDASLSLLPVGGALRGIP